MRLRREIVVPQTSRSGRWLLQWCPISSPCATCVLPKGMCTRKRRRSRGCRQIPPLAACAVRPTRALPLRTVHRTRVRPTAVRFNSSSLLFSLSRKAGRPSRTGYPGSLPARFWQWWPPLGAESKAVKVPALRRAGGAATAGKAEVCIGRPVLAVFKKPCICWISCTLPKYEPTAGSNRSLNAFNAEHAHGAGEDLADFVDDVGGERADQSAS